MSEEKNSKNTGSKGKESGIASGTTSVGAGERPAWCQLTAKLRWWSESQKQHLPVYVTKIDDKKKSVIVTFAADKKVWKEVPFSKLGRKGCPLQPPVASKGNGEAKDGEKSKERPAEDGTATPDWWRLEKSKILDKKEQSRREKALEEEMKQIEAKEVAKHQERKRKALLEAERRKVQEAFEKRKREAEQQKLREEEEWRQQLRERREREAKEEEEREREREAKREKKRQEKEKKKKIEEAEESKKRQAKEAEDRKKREGEEKDKAQREAEAAKAAAESARLQAEIMRQLPGHGLMVAAQAAQAWQQQALPLAMAQAAQAAQVAQVQAAAQAQAAGAFGCQGCGPDGVFSRGGCMSAIPWGAQAGAFNDQSAGSFGAGMPSVWPQ
ncbi:unnamed protein product [Durusdinium trenchii]